MCDSDQGINQGANQLVGSVIHAPFQTWMWLENMNPGNWFVLFGILTFIIVMKVMVSFVGSISIYIKFCSLTIECLKKPQKFPFKWIRLLLNNYIMTYNVTSWCISHFQICGCFLRRRQQGRRREDTMPILEEVADRLYGI